MTDDPASNHRAGTREAGLALLALFPGKAGWDPLYICRASASNAVVGRDFQTGEAPHSPNRDQLCVQRKPSAGHVYQDLLNRLKRMAYVML